MGQFVNGTLRVTRHGTNHLPNGGGLIILVGGNPLIRAWPVGGTAWAPNPQVATNYGVAGQVLNHGQLIVPIARCTAFDPVTGVAEFAVVSGGQFRTRAHAAANATDDLTAAPAA